ncbi:MAG: YidC/Oxa1 family insertase periplasmic-domain containing protein [Treponema sp.]|nr:YidC/Oxa1 family insertase periplasmic-domain containing protein [Treponema sp.]
MEKNTVIAIVLSALVLVGSVFVQKMFIIPRQEERLAAQKVEQIEQQKAVQEQAEALGLNEKEVSAERTEETSADESSKEEKFVIKTDMLKVTFTSKGGDIVSYKLLKHLDKDARLKGDERKAFNESVSKLYSLVNKNAEEVLLDENTSGDKDKLTKIVKVIEESENNFAENIEVQNSASVLREYLGIEMVDNVTDTNRAFAITFGDSKQPVRNEIFSVKTFENNPLRIGFYKTYERKDELGNVKPLQLFKTYSFVEGEYVFKLDISVKSENGLTVGNNSYTIRTSPQIGPFYEKSNRYEVRQYVAFNGSKKTKKDLDTKVYDKPYDWAGVAGKYFALLIKPAAPSTMIPETVTSNESVSDYQNSQLFLQRSAITDTSVNDTYFVYVGPRSESELKRYNKNTDNSWNLSEAKFNEAMLTGGFLNWIEIVLKFALENINKLVNNWGVAIIILTIILKIILFPLNKKTSMGSIKMQQIQPKLKEVQEKYKGDPRRMQLETSKLYKQVGYSPVAGCLPMIFQMIILISLYNVFNSYFEFRGAKFISGWIDDLSIGDIVYKFEANIPFISGFTMNTIRALPIIYTGSQFITSKITQYGNPTSGGQMKFMMYGLPLIFFFLFYNVPSGLLLYWTTSNILQIGQQIIINSIMKKKREELALSQPVVNANVLKFKGGKKKTR